MNHPAVGHGVGDVQIAKVSHSPFEKEVHPHDKRYGGINVRTGREEAEVEGTREKWDAHYDSSVGRLHGGVAHNQLFFTRHETW